MSKITAQLQSIYYAKKKHKPSLLLALGLILVTSPEKKYFTLSKEFLWKLFNQEVDKYIKEI